MGTDAEAEMYARVTGAALPKGWASHVWEIAGHAALGLRCTL